MTLVNPSPYHRQLKARLMTALGDTPAVCLAGASRTGKTALVLALQVGLPEAAYRTFTDPATLAEAALDPAEFLRGLPALAFLDDVERIPAILPWLKPASASGQRFLLTTAGACPGWRKASPGAWSPLRFGLLPRRSVRGPFQA